MPIDPQMPDVVEWVRGMERIRLECGIAKRTPGLGIRADVVMEFISAPWVPVAERAPDPYRPLLPDTAPIFFSHADLYPGNILVVKSPQGSQTSISGIVDWEQAGWYPDYWEYCKTMIVGRYDDEWKEQGWVDIAFQPSERDAEAYEAFEFYWGSRCP